jgi:hypothetical protein
MAKYFPPFTKADIPLLDADRYEARLKHKPRVHTRDRTRYRTIWISDIHLGTRGCNADLLIDFLDHVDSDTLYLVGDIIDGWRMKKRFFWPDSHNDIFWRILKRARRGTRIVYIPGNHDEMFRQFTGLNFGGVEIRRSAIHETADGRRLLVLLGDEIRHGDARPSLARGCRRRRLCGADAGQLAGQQGPQLAGPSLLVAVQNGQAQGQKYGRVHRSLRRNSSQGG